MKVTVGSLISLLALLACDRPKADDDRVTDDTRTPASPRPSVSDNATDASNAPQQPPASTSVSVGGLATCEATAPVNAAIERMARVADTDGNGEVSRSEATALANFALGGVFFRADANGDGTVSPEEGREIRKELLQRYPQMEAVVLAARASGRKTFSLPVTGADLEYGKPLTIAELRTAAKSLVDDMFGFADKNNSDSIGLDEARSAGREGVRALGRTAFDSMDADRDGSLKFEELKQLIDTPLRRAFDLADSDRNQRLTMDEATAALSQLSQTVGIPHAAATPSNQPNSGTGGGPHQRGGT